MTRIAPRLAAAFLCVTLAGSSFAQFGGGMGSGMGGRRGAGSGGGTPSAPRGDVLTSPTSASSEASSRLYDMRVRLMITKEQAAPWDAFEAKAWDLLVHNALRAPAESDGTAAQVVRMRAGRVQTGAQQWSALADAVDRLYDVLSPEQRQLADHDLLAVLPAGAAGSEGSGPAGEPGSGNGGRSFRRN